MNHELLKNVRSIAGYTQKQLASKIGVHESLISKIENGAVPIQPKTTRKILQAFSDSGITEKDIVLLQDVFESKKLGTDKQRSEGDLRNKQTCDS